MVNGVTDTEKAFIVSVVKRVLPTSHLLVFGSRVSGAAKKYSDLDIAVDASPPPSLAQLGQISALLADGDLPFKVDLIALDRVDPSFRSLIEEKCVRWP